MLNPTRSLRTVLAIALSAASIGAARAARPSIRNESRSRIQAPPTPLTFDPIQNVGHTLNHKVKSFVESQLTAGQFENEYDFPVDKEGGGKCILTVRAAKNSQYITRKNPHKPNEYGYVVALIRNQYPCKPKRFSLGKNGRAAWIVRFDSEDEYTDRRVVGTAYVVSLGGAGADEFLATWSFWQCGSKHDNIPTTASAVIQNETNPADICGTANPDHNAARVSGERLAAFRAQALVDQGDPAVWFACGTDCCYSELRS